MSVSSPFMQRTHFPSDSAWSQKEPRTPTGPPPVHTATLFPGCETSVLPPGFAGGNAKSADISRDASSSTLSVSSATDVDASTTLADTSAKNVGGISTSYSIASTSVSVASNATDTNASGAMDADVPGSTHDAAASIATDSASSTIAAGGVGAMTGGLPLF
ncbi:mucin-21-like [Penaeus vannamei]|uniref:mucin-21-like n=1 Tax=Penaeus vannamei TaxID=6689 RepID=UPI00387FABC9